MNDDDDDARDEMQRRLGAALAAGGSAPQDIVERAVGLLRWRRDGTIADIVDDDIAVAAVRGTSPTSTSLEFTDGTVRIWLATDAGRIMGEVSPWIGGRVVLEVDREEVEARVDDRGRFSAEHASGTVGRIRVEPAGSVPIWTSVIRLSGRHQSM